MENETLTALPTNFIKRVEQIINEYNSTGFGLVHGFQKDVIQNAVGARATNSWNNWKCSIDLIETPKGKFLTVTDYGTEGLTGPNKKIAEIAQMCDNNETFPEDWRLARISCNNVSGGLTTGAGLFGIGKTLYSAASNSSVCRYYFESLTIGFGYRCNVNDKNKSNTNGAFEGDNAKKYIKEKTGLDPINHVGTRITICDPKAEIIESIINGEMLYDIEETWWRIMPFFQQQNTGIFVNGVKACTPKQYSSDNYDENHFYEDEKSTIVCPDLNLRTKKVGFFLCKKLDERLRGFFFYRRGMKIGQINLSDVLPKNLQDKYFGYIEVQPDWENELVALENITHYDIQSTKKGNKYYSEMRHFVTNLVTEKLKEWGFIKEKESEDKLLHSLLSEIKEDIQSLFKDEGFENLGKGDLKSQYNIRFKDIVFPHPEERKTVYDNDKIAFKFIVKSSYCTKKKFFVEIKIVSPNGFSNILSTSSIEIDPLGKYTSQEIVVDINETTAEKYIDNFIVLSIYPSSGRRVEAKKIIFYYAIDTKKAPEKDFDLVMSNRTLPRIGDKRVNSNESISDIVYSFSNNLERQTRLRLSVSTHNLEDNASLIEKIGTFDCLLNPFETIESAPFDIIFLSEVYDDVVKKGKIDLRARLVVAEDNGIYEKGDEVAEYKFTIFYNMNEKRGMEDSFTIHPTKEPENPRRAWSDGHTGDWRIYVNIGHPEYLKIDDEMKKMFLEKLVIREFVVLYLKEGKYDQIGFNEDPDGSRTNHIDVLANMLNKIDEMWWKKCQQS